MPLVESFDPVIGVNPKVLILGSMPGVKSLQVQQYYAHPRNAFWPIMSALFDIDWAVDYDTRIEQFKALPLALWDVLGACHREGSLDADISQEQLQVNPIDRLLQEHLGISLIVFNGATAERFFRQKAAESISNLHRYSLLKLPSTSPAHASRTLQQKLDEWQAIGKYLNNIG